MCVVLMPSMTLIKVEAGQQKEIDEARKREKAKIVEVGVGIGVAGEARSGAPLGTVLTEKKSL